MLARLSKHTCQGLPQLLDLQVLWKGIPSLHQNLLCSVQRYKNCR